MTHTAAITVLITLGGFFMDLTKVMSAGLRVSSAAKAATILKDYINLGTLISLWIAPIGKI